MKILIKLSILFLVLYFSNGYVFSQKRTNHRKCATVEVMDSIFKANPAMKIQNETMQKFIDKYIQEQNGNTSKSIIYIPLVFHVVLSPAQMAIFPDSRIIEQVDALNRDFSGQNPHSMGPFPTNLKTNTNIQFYLASVNPNGNPTNGIERRDYTGAQWATNPGVKHYANGGLDSWPTTTYLNVWVADLGNGLCGYGLSPAGATTNPEFGLVCNYEYTGITGAVAPYNNGSTSTHEIAHCFNLIHIWADSQGCTPDDGCNDTPPQDIEQYGNPIPPIYDACTSSGNGLMCMNFMDYVDDIVYANFTPDQATRMQACFAPGGPLQTLVQSQQTSMANAGEDVYTCNQLTATLNAILNISDNNYHWLPQTGITYDNINSPTANITGNSYGIYNLIWQVTNTITGISTDTVSVYLSESPTPNAGAHYWPGIYGPVSHIKTDTVCGLAYQMSAIPSIGTGHWYYNTPENVHFASDTGMLQSPVPNDSLFMPSYSVFTPIKYREFIWQENNNGCIISDTLRLYSAPIPSGQLTISPPACPQNNFNLIANTWPLPNNVDYGITNFEWIYPNGIMDPTITNPTASDTVLINWPYGNQHNVSLVTTNQWGCSSILNSQILNEPASGRIIGQLSSSSLIDYSAYEINLYKAQVNTEASIVDTISLTSLGDFNFEVFGAGNFYVKANLLNPNNTIPYTNSYYNNAWEWSNAQIVTLSCEDTINLNFQLYGYTPTSGGTGTINGKVRYDLSNEPVADAFVYLQYKPTDEPALIAKTNSLGEYSMSGIPMGNYRMTCEIPGLPQITTHHLVFSPANYIYNNVNFIVDSSTIAKNYGFGIYADTTGFIGVNEYLIDKFEFTYFPNPASDFIKVMINNNVIENTFITIYNIEGKKLIEKTISQHESIVNINSLSSGIYTIEIKNEKIRRRDKLIKK